MNLKTKEINKIVAILTINEVLLLVFLIVYNYPIIGHILALHRPKNVFDLYKLVTCSIVHFQFHHIISNLIAFDIISIFTIFNEDNWYHIIGVILFASIFSSIGHLYFSIRGAHGAIGFSGCVFAIGIYTTMSYRKNCIFQLILLLFMTLQIAVNYRMIANPFHSIGVDIHIWGAASGCLYRILQGIFSEMWHILKNFIKTTLLFRK